MHLRPYSFLVTHPNQVNEWRGKYKGCKVTIFKRHGENKKPYFIFKIEHQRGTYDCYTEDGKTFDSLDAARDEAVKWINLYSFLNGPFLALSHYK